MKNRLEWMNGAHIRMLPLDDLYDKVSDFWPPKAADASDDYKRRVLGPRPRTAQVFYRTAQSDKLLLYGLAGPHAFD